MGSLAAVNHITFVTSDLDRLVGSLGSVRGTQTDGALVPEPEGLGRHALITLGGV
jgi:hypothetical protein